MSVPDGVVLAGILCLIDENPRPNILFGAPALSLALLEQNINVAPLTLPPQQVIEVIKPLSDTLFESPRKPKLKELKRGSGKEIWIVFDIAQQEVESEKSGDVRSKTSVPQKQQNPQTPGPPQTTEKHLPLPMLPQVVEPDRSRRSNPVAARSSATGPPERSLKRVSPSPAAPKSPTASRKQSPEEHEANQIEKIMSAARERRARMTSTDTLPNAGPQTPLPPMPPLLSKQPLPSTTPKFQATIPSIAPAPISRDIPEARISPSARARRDVSTEGHASTLAPPVKHTVPEELPQLTRSKSHVQSQPTKTNKPKRRLSYDELPAPTSSLYQTSPRRSKSRATSPVTTAVPPLPVTPAANSTAPYKTMTHEQPSNLTTKRQVTNKSREAYHSPPTSAPLRQPITLRLDPLLPGGGGVTDLALRSAVEKGEKERKRGGFLGLFGTKKKDTNEADTASEFEKVSATPEVDQPKFFIKDNAGRLHAVTDVSENSGRLTSSAMPHRLPVKGPAQQNSKSGHRTQEAKQDARLAETPSLGLTPTNDLHTPDTRIHGSWEQSALSPSHTSQRGEKTSPPKSNDHHVSGHRRERRGDGASQSVKLSTDTTMADTAEPDRVQNTPSHSRVPGSLQETSSSARKQRKVQNSDSSVRGPQASRRDKTSVAAAGKVERHEDSGRQHKQKDSRRKAKTNRDGLIRDKQMRREEPDEGREIRAQKRHKAERDGRKGRHNAPNNKQSHRHRDIARRELTTPPPTAFLTQVFEGLPFGPDLPSSTIIEWVSERWQVLAVEMLAVVLFAYVVQASGF